MLFCNDCVINCALTTFEIKIMRKTMCPIVFTAPNLPHLLMSHIENMESGLIIEGEGQPKVMDRKFAAK